MRRGAKPRKAKVVAKRPRPRTSPKDEASKRHDLEKRLAESLEREKSKDRALTEALEQQTATSEVLGAISRSPTDIQPVLDTVVESAARLCEAYDASIVLRRDNRLVMAAHHGPIHDASAIARALGTTGGYTLSLDRGTIGGRTVLDARTVHIADVQVEAEEFPEASENARRLGFHTMLSVPLMREGVAIGAIQLPRTEVRLFTERQVALLKTFADQAVIAIENVRLFKETKEALEQQTATSEILRVISSSPTDAQPVFDAIAASATRLCDGVYSVVFRYDGEVITVAADNGRSAETSEVIRSAYPAPPGRRTIAARTLLERRVIAVTDAQDSRENPDGAERARAIGYRAGLSVPMMCGDVAIGAINVVRVEAIPFTDTQIELLKTFAEQAVIAIENVRLSNETKEALEQQMATSEILGVISSSPTDIQPVLDAVSESAARLCEAYDAVIYRLADDRLVLAAHHGPIPVGRLGETWLPLGRGTANGRAMLEARTVHVADQQAEVGNFPEGSDIARQRGYRTLLVVPLVRDGVPIGTIGLRRTEVRLFTERQVSLLQSFSDQAVIAIENVRLFTELQEKNRALTQAHAQVTETLEQQTATSEILRAIAHSQTDVQPVFETIVRNAAQLCQATSSLLWLLEGDRLRIVAPDNLPRNSPTELALANAPNLIRTIRDGAIHNIGDTENDPRITGEAFRLARLMGARAVLTVPMRRDREGIGALTVYRRSPGVFTDGQVELLKTFTDQAVIAIENVRLFKELEKKNQALTESHAQVTESLEQQTATAEILRVISRSQTDVQPVFDAIVRSASQLCDGADCIAVRFDGELMHLMARHNPKPGTLESLAALFPRRPSRGGTATDRAILEGHMVHVPDILEDPTYDQRRARAAQLRSVLSVPLMRAGNVIGAISPSRAVPGLFSDRQVELLKTFADQAVIAIENVRLFKELEARTAELTHSVEQLTALGEVGRAVSSTLDLETVLTTIVSRAVELSRLDGGVVFEYEEAAEEFVHRAATETGGALAEARRATRVQKGEGVVGRTAITLEPVQVPDITMPGAHESRLRENLIESGVRAILAVPMVREGRLIGSLVVSRNQPGDFPTETIELLRTFATQSALAIQNARLFHEIADKSRQLEAASRHKSEFLANMSHELRTPLNAIIGFSEVLTERMFGELNEKQDEYLKDIYASGQHLLSLINDILDLSKIEAGRMELEATDFDLPSTIDNALILVRERASRRGITLGHSVDERLGSIRGDERKVKQVLLNLLSNALKFTPEGGRIDVSAEVKNGVAEIAVADTGVGIAREDQEAVFEEFRQVGTADKKVEGTGLGLALSRKFIELHGGRIWVKSQVGHGSTFTFTLPVRREE